MNDIGRLTVILGTLTALASCHTSSKGSQGTDVCGDIKTLDQDIYYGVDHPEIMTLTDGQLKAIGALNLSFSGLCSATVVAPRVVLTAAHCVENLSPGDTVNFLSGATYLPPELSLSSHEWHIHPDYAGSSGGYGSPPYDIAVLILDADARTQGVEPIPINVEHYVLAGQIIQAVGYGTTEDGGWNTRRWWTTMPVVWEQALYYATDGQDVTGICSGDSGGPMLFDIPGQGIHVMGVVSSGEEGCVGLTFYPRTDAYVDWLDDYLPVGPCAEETLAGRCDGTTAIWCEDDTIWTHACADFGYVCGDEGTGNMRCIEPPPPCNGETFEGRCDGQVAIWCEGEDVLYHDCASFGYVCDRNADHNFRCVPPGSVDECTLLGFVGECVDMDGHQHARWCADGVIRDRDCTLCDQTCGWAGDALGNYCL